MKKFYLIPLLLLLFTGCGYPNENTPGEHSERIEIVDWITPEETSQITPVQIAIVTQEWQREQNENWIAELQARHGKENVTFHTWAPGTSFHAIPNELLNSIERNTDIDVLIINPAFETMRTMADLLGRQRPGMFIALYDPIHTRIHYVNRSWHNTPLWPFYRQNAKSSAGANLILDIDMRGIFQNLPQSAQSLGATTLIYFYDSISWDERGNSTHNPEEGYTRRLLREASEAIGLEFVATDISGAIRCVLTEYEFMTTVLPSLVANHGNDIVFVGIDQWSALREWERNDTIFLPLYGRTVASPGMVASLYDIPREHEGGITDGEMLIHEIRTILDQQNRLGRIATWPTSKELLFPLAAAEYGVMWANGSVPRYELDLAALEEIFARIIFEHTGEQLGVTLTQEGNRVLVLPDYLIY
ncbi:MAG: hypothetical protein FWC70_06510 [Defluviitaleaceae bacterium]|nr:hypothetical protein [Defluviitaleaceae bacterium]